ncbi:MAG TPA: hypothetical protein VE604_16590 [Candidatus Polarisedimenticolia bacterium]|nr:hypothetical protein [Candidatus Polarisedimenticolia bacterium]
MMEGRYSPEHEETNPRVPEARYAYYRRCQVFRKGGEQCKAPAEKGAHICHAHAGQLATALRRERERQAVLADAVAQMRRRGRPECEMADLFMDFKGINVTLAVMAKALIDGRIDCKTAGRLVVQLQTVSKLLWILHRKGREGRKENRISPQISAEERRLGKPREWQESIAVSQRSPKTHAVIEAEKNWAANQGEERRIALVAQVRGLADRRGWGHAPPELLRAA